MLPFRLRCIQVIVSRFLNRHFCHNKSWYPTNNRLALGTLCLVSNRGFAPYAIDCMRGGGGYGGDMVLVGGEMLALTKLTVNLRPMMSSATL